MGYIKFDKEQLINLNYSLSREKLRTNRTGSYASSTIINCNTRSYHGLLVVPQPLIDDNNHVLLSGLDETLQSNQFEFHLGSRMYQGGVMEPKGHKYLRDYDMDPIPRLVFRLGSIVLIKELIFTQKEDRILIRYTLEESVGTVKLQLRPFLAYRSVHSLSKANTYVNTRFKPAKNGVSWQMYQGYSPVFMQLSKKPEYVHVPDWYYNVQYLREKERGYDYLEDLFTPGYFEVALQPGESVVISAGTAEENPASFKRKFTAEIKKRVPRSSFENSLQNAAEEFLIHVKNGMEIIAGYHWFGRWGRDTFIALPGLTLTRGDKKAFHAVVKTMLRELKNGLFPNLGHGKEASYNSADTSLWFFWALHQYALMTGETKELWNLYGKAMKSILFHYKKGTLHQIRMHDNGLIWAGEPGNAVTWMDAVVDGKPVTARIGFPVEINALWYEAIRFALQLAEEAGDEHFVSRWKKWPAIIEKSFAMLFWDAEKGYLADYVTYENKDFTIRPNMVIAASLPYTPVTLDMKIGILAKAKNELLTPRGLRSLSPRFPNYKGKYQGNQQERDMAYHQGTAWPWLLGPFAETWLSLYGEKGNEFIRGLYDGFEAVMTEAGVGTISEIYDGDPPHEARGAISQAWSVAELLRIKWMLDHQKNQ
jgi:predicted glycogen debranching enzyme